MINPALLPHCTRPPPPPARPRRPPVAPRPQEAERHWGSHEVLWARGPAWGERGRALFEHTPGTGLSLACTYLYLSCVTCTVRPWEFPRSGLRPLVVTQGHRVPRFDGSSQIPTCGGNNRSTDPDINTVTHAPTDHRNMDIRTIHGVFTSSPRAACLVPTARELRV